MTNYQNNKNSFFETEIDLNSIFNLNYNFDLLKNIIDALIKNQKDQQKAINDIKSDSEKKNNIIYSLQKEVVDMSIELKQNDPEKLKELEQKKKQLVEFVTINHKQQKAESNVTDSLMTNQLTVSL